ncbi:MAG: hypothetical protein AAGF35_08720 [Pseudomonadota bacterium]
MDWISKSLGVLNIGLVIACGQEVAAQVDANAETNEAPRGSVMFWRGEGEPDLYSLGQEGSGWIKYDSSNLSEMAEGAFTEYQALEQSRVKSFDAGFRANIRGDAVPVVDVDALDSLDIAALKPIFDALEQTNIVVNDLDIRFPEHYVEQTTPLYFVRLSQYVNGHDVGHVKVYLDREDGAARVRQVSAFLIDPNIPELNPNNWISEDEAIQIATDILMRDVKQDANSENFLMRVRQNTLKGKVIMEVGSSPNSIEVNPIYQVSGIRSVVEVNLYSGTIRSFDITPLSLTTQMNTRFIDQEMPSASE